jgi:hypothetical protein
MQGGTVRICTGVATAALSSGRRQVHKHCRLLGAKSGKHAHHMRNIGFATWVRRRTPSTKPRADSAHHRSRASSDASNELRKTTQRMHPQRQVTHQAHGAEDIVHGRACPRALVMGKPRAQQVQLQSPFAQAHFIPRTPQLNLLCLWLTKGSSSSNRMCLES